MHFKNMYRTLALSLILLAGSTSCSNSQENVNGEIIQSPEDSSEIFSPGNTVSTRFRTPEHFIREELDSNSFGFFLRSLPLHPEGHRVHYYNGEIKSNEVYAAVVNLPIGTKDLHQCADAVMRLRADYLRAIGKSSEIHFNFTNGFRCDYSNWLAGHSVLVKGNKVSWGSSSGLRADNDKNYWNYLEKVFTYAGTLSLSKELKAKEITALEIGDVFIQGGSPGHAVIVVELCVNEKTGEKRFMLAQSYMPAQEIQVLFNPRDYKSVWFELPANGILRTPEWTFESSDLKSF